MIPKEWGHNELYELLKSLYKGKAIAVNAIERAEESFHGDIKIRSLAAHAVYLNFKVATAEINPLPPQLHKLINKTETIELPVNTAGSDHDHLLYFDTSFEGLTTLYSPNEPAVE